MGTRRLLLCAPMIAVLGLSVGCGNDKGNGDDVAHDRSTQGTTSAQAGEPEPGDAGRFEVQLFHATAAGGRVDRTLTQVRDVHDVDRVIGTVRGPELRAQVTAAVHDLLAAERPAYLAVITVGCDVPPGALVRQGDDGELVVVPRKVPDPLPECFAPVVTVAVVSDRV